MTGYATAAHAYTAAGWKGVLPLPTGQKTPPPGGYTGREGTWPTHDQLEQWTAAHPAGNIALRLPQGVVGVDVDQYADKRGGDTLAERETIWGPLPPTWRSSARDDPISGIRLYAIRNTNGFLAHDVELQTVIRPDIEIIQHHHRYLVAWPSAHPNRTRYRWYRPDGTPADAGEIPTINDLPSLPTFWVASLHATAAPLNGSSNGHRKSTGDDIRRVFETFPTGQPCRAVNTRLDEALNACSGGSRHDTLLAHVAALVRLGEQGHTGALDALGTLEQRFVAAVAADRHGGQTEAEREYDRMVTGAVDKVNADPTSDVDKGCCGPTRPDTTWWQHSGAHSITAAAGSPSGAADVPVGTRTPLEERTEYERITRQARRIVDLEERPPAEHPTIRTLTDLLAEGIPPIAWRITDMQPAGTRVVLAAQFKAGKTTLTANLVRSLADGEPFLGRYPVAELDGTIAIVDFEMSPRQLLAWLQDQGIRNTDKVLPICLRGNGTAFEILSPEGRQRWADTLKRHNVEYVIWDCLRPVVDAFGLDEHTGVGPLLVAYDQLLADAAVPDTAIAHHMGHHGERSRGDSRIRDWPDVEWRLVRQDDDPSSPRFLSAYGRDVDVREARLDYDETTRHLTMIGGTRQTAKIDDAVRLALPYITENPGQSATKIVDALCKGADSPGQNLMRKALKVAVDDGRVHVETNPHGGHLHYNPHTLTEPSRTLTREGEEDPHTLTYRGEGPSGVPSPPNHHQPSHPTCNCPCHRGAGGHNGNPCPTCTAPCPAPRSAGT